MMVLKDLRVLKVRRVLKAKQARQVLMELQ